MTRRGKEKKRARNIGEGGGAAPEVSFRTQQEGTEIDVLFFSTLCTYAFIYTYIRHRWHLLAVVLIVAPLLSLVCKAIFEIQHQHQVSFRANTEKLEILHVCFGLTSALPLPLSSLFLFFSSRLCRLLFQPNCYTIANKDELSLLFSFPVSFFPYYYPDLLLKSVWNTLSPDSLSLSLTSTITTLPVNT